MADCRRELKAQGWHVGWSKVHAGLGGRYSTTLVQECLLKLKKDHKKDREAVAALCRHSVRVTLGEVLWSLDETHLGRLPSWKAVLGLVVREVASTRTLLVSVGPEATAEDLVRVLEHLRMTRGALPLALGIDNGPAMKSRLLLDYCTFHEVVLLRNLPYVSEHNAAVEHGHRELKEEAGLGKGVRLEDDAEAAARMAEAIACVDGRRLRTTRGMKTAVAVDEETPRWYPRIERRVFYVAACKAIGEALQGCQNARERRMAEREAILCTMQRFGLISRTRGGEPIQAPIRKSIP